jgi:hypothetical protein
MFVDKRRLFKVMKRAGDRRQTSIKLVCNEVKFIRRNSSEQMDDVASSLKKGHTLGFDSY